MSSDLKGPTPLSAEEAFEKLMADVRERLRPYREEMERQEQENRRWQTTCSCPSFCYFHTRLK